MRLKERAAVVAVLVAAGIAGCTGSGSTPVEGIVTLDGAPLPGAYVMFYPGDDNRALPHIGTADEQGRYVLKPVKDDQEGLRPGLHRVVISTAVAPPGADENAPLPPERVPAKYRDGTLGFEVPEGGDTNANFELESR